MHRSIVEGKLRKQSSTNTPNYWTCEDDDSNEEFKFIPFVETNEPFWLLTAEDENTPSHGVLQPIMADRNKNDPISSLGGRGCMLCRWNILWSWRRIL